MEVRKNLSLTLQVPQGPLQVALLRLEWSMILADVIAAKSKNFVLHLKVLS